MIKITVIPQKVWERIAALPVPAKEVLSSCESLLKYLSGNDIAEIIVATDKFEFVTSDGLVSKCGLPDGIFTNAIETRVETRLTTPPLDEADNYGSDMHVSMYTAVPIDGDYWVAVQQRRHIEGRDPKTVKYLSNRGFFDKLIASALTVMSFETLSKSTLFNNYMKSIPA